ncbi:MAG TPA: aminopeptidase P family N-terminal domain-containing protein [Beijerinckiaceae bacterium]|jgi:hypothetical protein|nr:aminopeptidase P family N-terminal domain-containing protein [Beijerinckiaceae bacterium]
MRRGLMAWDEQELPRAALETRVALLREAVQAIGCDGFVAYTNIAKGAAVAWLSGFQPYWNEGLFYVPATGTPLFATALSKRVAEWIGSVMPIGQVQTTPKPALLIAQHIAQNAGQNKTKRIAILELDDFPAGHAKTFLENIPGVELVDGTAAFAKARAHVDTAERGLLAHADRLAETGLAAIDAKAANAQQALAPCDEHARLGGAEECFATVAPDLQTSARFQRTDTAGALGQTFAVRSSLAYKATWVRRTRSFTRDANLVPRFAAADGLLASFQPPTEGSLAKAIAGHFTGPDLRVESWLAEQPAGSSPLSGVAASAGSEENWQRQAPFVLNIELSLNGARWLGARLVG